MKTVLVYSEAEAQRNAFAVRKFRNELGAEPVTPDYRGAADFVINRSNDFKVAEFYEARGVRVFNPSAFSRLANDKQAAYDFMENNGIQIMPTRYTGVPFVKKPRDGHGGRGVVMCRSTDEYDGSMVCQKPASDLGRDLRVWILGGKIRAAMLRVSNTDFRSNFCLGGEAVPYELSSGETALINKITALVKGDYYGIDFVFDGGKAVFNELEDAVGARMLYAKTDIDILGEYCDYIRSFF
ncbi:MAG: ATP-grasp domain-containing protein [Ruminococcaceae bacterium]|nr:ATP-grasp domain-containing protein [Oscillospiraceae bacterium]